MKVLRSRSGVSLMFVLATMMLLIVMGVSAIVAAGLNAGASAVQRDRTQLELYASSIDRTIRDALAVTEAPNRMLSATQTLGGQILREAISNSEMFPEDPGGREVPVEVRAVFNNTDPTDDDPVRFRVTRPAGVDAVYTVVVSGNLRIVKEPYLRASTEGPVTIPSTPMMATVTGEITVEVMTVFTPAGAFRPLDPYTFSSFTTYSLNGSVVLEETGTAVDDGTKIDPPLFGDMILRNAISWTVIRHETIG